MNKSLKQRWNALTTALLGGTIFSYFGINFALTPNAGGFIFGAISLTLGILCFIAYRWQLDKLRKKGDTRLWIKPLDVMVIIAIIITAGWLATYDSEASPLTLIVACAYINWKLYRYMRPLWRVYYFRAAREYFRETKYSASK